MLIRGLLKAFACSGLKSPSIPQGGNWVEPTRSHSARLQGEMCQPKGAILQHFCHCWESQIIRLWLGLLGMTSELIKNQHSVTHKFQAPCKATKHLFTKIQKIEKKPSDYTNICLCLYCYCQEKTIWGFWMRLPEVGLFFLQASGRCVDFLCPS